MYGRYASDERIYHCVRSDSIRGPSRPYAIALRLYLITDQRYDLLTIIHEPGLFSLSYSNYNLPCFSHAACYFTAHKQYFSFTEWLRCSPYMFFSQPTHSAYGLSERIVRHLYLWLARITGNAAWRVAYGGLFERSVLRMMGTLVISVTS